MPFPKNLAELREAGYEFKSFVSCQGCGARIEFWRTPEGRLMPLDVKGSEVTPHWATCPKADEFRRSKHGNKDKEKSKTGQANPQTKITPGND